MTYPETLRYLESLVNYEDISAYPYRQSLKLERMRGLLATLGNPHDALSCVHVAGSKGKGSVCAFIAYILKSAGYRVGLYTSPHLSDFRERIRVMDKHAGGGRAEFEGMIARDDTAELMTQLRPKIEAHNRVSPQGPLTFFEVYTALAFVYFQKRKVDIAVLETGMGGRLDATNTVCPLVCVLTPVSYEHTDKLGTTLAQIAREKSGIIKKCKRGTTSYPPAVVSARQETEAALVIRRRCKMTGARLQEAGRDFFCRRSAGTLGVYGPFGKHHNLTTKLIGGHQALNASLAVAAVEALRFQGFSVSPDEMKSGVADAVWPGRCEVIGRKPLVIIDGAQNTASCRALKAALRENFRYRRLVLVIGMSRDKDIAGVCGRLRGIADSVVVTAADNPRACDPGLLARHFPGMKTIITESVASAREHAYALAGKGDAILVCGSLFVIGEFKYGLR